MSFEFPHPGMDGGAMRLAIPDCSVPPLAHAPVRAAVIRVLCAHPDLGHAGSAAE